MLVHVLYDSVYGNTERIARAIGDALAADHEVLVAPIGPQTELAPDVGLLIVGGPTHVHGASRDMRQFLAGAGQIDGVPVASFDTRLDKARILTGAASSPIGRVLRRKGGRIIGAESFLVAAREGPILDGETDRAREWARRMAAHARSNRPPALVDLLL